jgi:nuclear transcription factor Y, gamma
MADDSDAAAAAAAASVYPQGGLTQQQLMQQNQHTQRQMAHARLQLEQKLDEFWKEQQAEVQNASEFKNHLLPLARIKKIMKSDEDVRMISAEAPVLFAKACEMFILELTYRAWAQTEDAKRRTLQRSDISAAIQKTDIFDFLIDIVPREDTKKDDPRGPIAGAPGAPGPQAVDTQVQHYYQMPGAGAPTPYGAAGAAGVPEASAAMMYAQNAQQMYANTYASNMAYQQALNPQLMRMQQQMMYGGAPVGSYPAAPYMTAAGMPPGAGLPGGVVPGQPGGPQPGVLGGGQGQAGPGGMQHSGPPASGPEQTQPTS